MKSLLSQLLYGSVQLPLQGGRQIKFDIDEPDIMVATGPLEERVRMLMKMRGYPMSAREISAGIGSNASQVNKALRILMANDKVDVIEMPGCVKEYVLRLV